MIPFEAVMLLSKAKAMAGTNRAVCQFIRTKSYPISDLIPVLATTADMLDALVKQVEELNAQLAETTAMYVQADNDREDLTETVAKLSANTIN